MSLRDDVCTFDPDAFERTARLPVLKVNRLRVQPIKRRRGRTVGPGKARPLEGAALEEWQRWARGETAHYACRRAVV